MVAAHRDDLEAARALGLRTAFVRRPLEWGPDGQPDLERRPWVDRCATDMEDLAAALGC
jgi:2-haloacid dehalogenase